MSALRSSDTPRTVVSYCSLKIDSSQTYGLVHAKNRTVTFTTPLASLPCTPHISLTTTLYFFFVDPPADFLRSTLPGLLSFSASEASFGGAAGGV